MDDLFKGVELNEDELDEMFGLGAARRRRRKAPSYPWTIYKGTNPAGKLLNFGVFLGLLAVGLWAGAKLAKIGKEVVGHAAEAKQKWREPKWKW